MRYAAVLYDTERKAGVRDKGLVCAKGLYRCAIAEGELDLLVMKLDDGASGVDIRSQDFQYSLVKSFKDQEEEQDQFFGKIVLELVSYMNAR